MKFLDKPPDPFEKIIFKVEIPSEVSAKNPVIDRILGTIKERDLLSSSDEEMNIRLVLEEAVINGMRHGNKYDVSKKVKVAMGENAEGWGVIIEDEGDGFDEGDLGDPTDPAAIFLEGGRGIFLMSFIMDRVEFFNGGRGVFIFKSFPGEEKEGGE